MSDVEVVLGAKNEATAVLNQFRQEVAQTAQGVEFSIRGMAQLAGVGVAVQAIIATANEVFSFIGKANAAFDETNKVATRLAETLQITGSGAATEGLKTLASDLEKITNIDENKILGVMNAATRRGASANELGEMSKAAVGLARIYERDLSSAMQMVESAMAGNFESFKGLIPNIDSMATASEKMAAVSQLAATGLANQAKEADSAAEMANRSKIAWENLYKAVGDLVAPLRGTLVEGIQAVANALESVRPKTSAVRDGIRAFAEDARTFGQQAAESFVFAYTAIETAAKDIEGTLEIAVASVALSGERMYSSIEFAMRAMVEYGKWFSSNFLNILRDTAVSASFVVENMGKNIAIGIRRGMGEDIGFVSLLDGFEATTSKLPEIGERAVSETEKALQAILDNGVFKMFDAFDGNLRERLERLQQAMQRDLGVNLKPNADAIAKSATDSMRELSAFESRVLTRGPSETPLDRMLDIQRQLLEEQREANRIARDRQRPRDEVRLVKVGGAF